MNPCLAQWVFLEERAGLGQTWLVALLWVVAVGILSAASYALLSQPHRRLERARFFLDLIATGLARGRKPEETIGEIARIRDGELGVRLHLLAAHLESGLGLEAALDRVPALLPPQVRATLRAGMEAGRLSEAIAAGQEMLKDAPSRTQHVTHYLVFLFTAGTPFLLFILVMLQVAVAPKFGQLLLDVGEGMGVREDFTLLKLAIALGGVLFALNIVVVIGVVAHGIGPRLRRWLPPVADFLAFLVPWKRTRMLRDFTGSLALLLDARVPEERALKLAADATANRYYERRALRAMATLREGRGLKEALAGFDSTGELRWRIANASMGGQPFATALKGWRDALHARAFRAEQSSAHGITSVLILLNGLMVALVVLSLFGMLVKLIDAAALW